MAIISNQIWRWLSKWSSRIPCRLLVTYNIIWKCYTPLLVDICMCSWKAIVVMPVPSSEVATSLAWYSRMLRMRRGPSTNICTTVTNWSTALYITAPTEDKFCRNNQERSGASESRKSTYKYPRSQGAESEARDSTKTTTVRSEFQLQWKSNQSNHELTLQSKARVFWLTPRNSPW